MFNDGRYYAKQLSVRYRLNDADGIACGLRWRIFSSPSETIEFLDKLQSIEAARQAVAVSIAVRPVGEWSPISRLDLERFAAEEGGRNV